MRLRVDSEDKSLRSCLVIVANGQYIADGMQIAPHASLNDGLLDVIIVGDLTKSELLKIRPKLYFGGHIGHPKIREKKTTNIEIDSESQLMVEADGDIIGEGPVSFGVVSSALTVLV